MTTPIIVPELGESVLDATVSRWLKQQGDSVKVGEPLVELETDKVNLEVSATTSGVLQQIDRQENEDVKVGEVLGQIAESETAEEKPQAGQPQAAQKATREEEPTSANAPQKETVRQEARAIPYESGQAGGRQPGLTIEPEKATPVARKMIEEYDLDLAEVHGSGPGGRITKGDIEAYLRELEEQRVDVVSPGDTGEPVQKAAPVAFPQGKSVTQKPPAPLTKEAGVHNGNRPEEHIKMSRRRRTIAQRLVEAQHTAAILTTFNEIDMTAVIDLRKRRNEAFQKQYGTKLGFMSFFVKASVGALKAFPQLNAEIQEDEIVLKYYYDIGIAVGSPEGLVVPILRNADRLSFAGIEKKIADFVEKTEQGTLSLEDLRGGTFSITNGGIFGSLLSTPILTPPQVAILGMHKIEKRPIAVNDQVEIRPMMYVALSYDHRIVDGREAVQFLVRIKELIEDPERLLLEG